MIMIAPKFSLLRQLVWAATLATGFGTLWFVLVLLIVTSIQEAWQGGRRNWPPREELVVKSDGTPLIRSSPVENYSLATYRNLNGGVRDAPASDDLLPTVYIAGEHGTPGFISWPVVWAQRLKVFMNEQEPTVNWFFVHDGTPQGAGYFVGYERDSNRRVGFIGLSGFRSNPVPVDEWIPVRGKFMDYSPWNSAPFSMYSGRAWVIRPDRFDLPPRLVYVPSGNQLRKVDLAARTVTTVFETPEPIESEGIPTVASSTNGHTTKEQPILVRTRQQIHVLDHKHNPIRVFAIPAEVDRQSPGYWYDIGNGQAIVNFVRPWSEGESDNVTRHTVYRIADNGAIQERFELTLQSGSPATNKQTRAFQLALGLPVPAIVIVVDLFFETRIAQLPGYPAGVAALLKDSGPSLIAVFALSTILAVMAWRRSRAFGLSQREQIMWAVFVLLFGVPAYAGFLLHRRWPTRQPCPNCHAQAPRDRVACVECGTRFPDPSLKGIEIFA